MQCKFAQKSVFDVVSIRSIVIRKILFLNYFFHSMVSREKSMHQLVQSLSKHQILIVFEKHTRAPLSQHNSSCFTMQLSPLQGQVLAAGELCFVRALVTFTRLNRLFLSDETGCWGNLLKSSEKTKQNNKTKLYVFTIRSLK